MRRLDKSIILATQYKNWVDSLDGANTPHGKYTSSHKYYRDVAANLLWLQQGLCAYTEMFLADPEQVHPRLWDNGRFSGLVASLGTIDHFRSDMKKEKGWDWENLFMVLGKINQMKGTKQVYLLKPDQPGYAPEYYLDYDPGTHQFIVNQERNYDELKLILEDIDTLGLNFPPVISERRKILSPMFAKIEFGTLTAAEARKELDRFFTAFNMFLRHNDHDTSLF